MKVEIYNASTVEKEFYGDTNENFIFHKTKEGNVLKLNFFEVHPKYIKWIYKGKEIIINSEKAMLSLSKWSIKCTRHPRE